MCGPLWIESRWPTRIPRADAARNALGIPIAARELITRERTAALCALTALVRTEDLRIDARRGLTWLNCPRSPRGETQSTQDSAHPPLTPVRPDTQSRRAYSGNE